MHTNGELQPVLRPLCLEAIFHFRKGNAPDDGWIVHNAYDSTIEHGRMVKKDPSESP